jgi:hypothetical protein
VEGERRLNGTEVRDLETEGYKVRLKGNIERVALGASRTPKSMPEESKHESRRVSESQPLRTLRAER